MSSGNQIVKLNIGGAQFHALKSTLIKRSGFFKTLSETGAPVARDEFGAIFIDRSPEHFDLILNFMRDGDVELPDSEKEIKEIQKEADFYQLPSLIKLCEEKIPFKKFRHIKSDFELLDALAAYSKPVLIINYPESAFENLDKEATDILRFMKNNVHLFNVYFKSYTRVDENSNVWSWDYYNNFEQKSMPINGYIYPCGFLKTLEEVLKTAENDPLCSQFNKSIQFSYF